MDIVTNITPPDTVQPPSILAMSPGKALGVLAALFAVLGYAQAACINKKFPCCHLKLIHSSKPLSILHPGCIFHNLQHLQELKLLALQKLSLLHNLPINPLLNLNHLKKRSIPDDMSTGENNKRSDVREEGIRWNVEERKTQEKGNKRKMNAEETRRPDGGERRRIMDVRERRKPAHIEESRKKVNMEEDTRESVIRENRRKSDVDENKRRSQVAGNSVRKPTQKHEGHDVISASAKHNSRNKHDKEERGEEESLPALLMLLQMLESAARNVLGTAMAYSESDTRNNALH